LIPPILQLLHALRAAPAPTAAHFPENAAAPGVACDLLSFLPADPSTTKETFMNLDRMQGQWQQFRGKVLQQWGRLTDDELDVINGRRDVLAGKIQEAYGISLEEAEHQITEWEATLRAPDADGDEYAEAENTRRSAIRRS
jgi:uncharacterized protein YjbJ (UPF0337 family)